jgi:hypothetical protein
MMMLPQGYGQSQKAIRKGQFHGGLLDTITKVQSTIDTYEEQAKELERTQQQIQFLTTMGILVLGLGGSFLFYRLLKSVDKK